jgi:hypothetical protein
MANVAKTPSAVNKQEESLEHIELIVGNISEAVNMSEESLDSINENIVDGIVNKLDLHSTKLVAMTNSLMAMSGYMLGHKGINEKTSHASLLSKVKNTAPIFGEITIPETLFTLIDSIKEGSVNLSVSLNIELSKNFGLNILSLRALLMSLLVECNILIAFDILLKVLLTPAPSKPSRLFGNLLIFLIISVKVLEAVEIFSTAAAWDCITETTLRKPLNESPIF